MKVCKKCNTNKTFPDFSKSKNNKDVLNNWCKECNKNYLKSHYTKNKELYSTKSKENYKLNSDKIKENSKKWREDNPEQIKEYFKKYYSENKDILSEYKKEHYINNKDKYLNKAKNQRENNPEEYSEYLKNWRLENPEYMVEYWKNNKTSKKIYDFNYRIKYPHVIAWRHCLKTALIRIGGIKESSTIDILGYSSEEFKSHIESLFDEGMSWENWGEWHIDHKVPVSKFEKETPISIVNSLDNLQPLWAFDNLSKGNKIID